MTALDRDQQQSLVHQITADFANATAEALGRLNRPSVLFRPRLTSDMGGQWHAEYGSLSAFGRTPAEAISKFDEAWEGATVVLKGLPAAGEFKPGASLRAWAREFAKRVSDLGEQFPFRDVVLFARAYLQFIDDGKGLPKGVLTSQAPPDPVLECGGIGPVPVAWYAISMGRVLFAFDLKSAEKVTDHGWLPLYEEKAP